LTQEKRRTLAVTGRPIQLQSSEELHIDTIDEPSTLLERLQTTDNLYEQVELLGVLARLQSLDAPIQVGGQETTVAQLLQEVYEEAGRLRLWPVIRQAAGLL